MKLTTRDENFIIRSASEGDVKIILGFIRELAIYENSLDQVEASVETLSKSLFIDKSAEVIIGEYKGKPVGFALFFHNYSTWRANAGLYLEDLYIRPEMRGKGLGNIMLTFLAKLAQERGCTRFEWSCLDWNIASIEFYKSLGAQVMDEWTGYRLSGRNLERLACKEL